MNIRILVIDPEETMLEVCQRFLSKRGFHIFTTANGSAGGYNAPRT